MIINLREQGTIWKFSPSHSCLQSRDEENHHHFYMHANCFDNWWPKELQQNEWQDVYVNPQMETNSIRKRGFPIWKYSSLPAHFRTVITIWKW